MSKRTDAPHRSGPSKVWLKSKNPASEAVRREREESVTKFTGSLSHLRNQVAGEGAVSPQVTSVVPARVLVDGR